MNKELVYLETTIISYCTSSMSRDIVIAGHQKITKDWYQRQSKNFQLFSSEMVQIECAKGDPEISAKRLAMLKFIDSLEINDHVYRLADQFVVEKVIPEKYVEDSIHISIATVNGMDYLLTWNCKHIANAHLQKRLREIANQNGYELPVICTPEELMEV